MAAFTHWRVYITANGSDPYIQCAELTMHESVGGSNVCSGGTAFASGDLGGGEVPASAFDGNTGTYWTSQNGGPWALGYQFASAKDIKKITWTATGSNTTRNPYTAVVQASNDGSSWTDRGVWKQRAWLASQVRTFYPYDPTVDTDKIRFVKLNITDNNGHAATTIGEVAASDTASGSNILGLAVNASRQDASDSLLVDANAATYWVSFGDADIIFQLPVAVAYLAEVTITPRSDSGDATTQSPKDFEMLTSSDNTTFASVWTETNKTGWTMGVPRTFTNPTPPPADGGSPLLAPLSIGLPLGL
jgi:hypothetical protein